MSDQEKRLLKHVLPEFLKRELHDEDIAFIEERLGQFIQENVRKALSMECCPNCALRLPRVAK